VPAQPEVNGVPCEGNVAFTPVKIGLPATTATAEGVGCLAEKRVLGDI
tara:strand:- start:627 stop:770 length:144 start_codon:yes stop_codon:yes gene_type:complete